ncbi:MAG: hypothetical protein HQL20_04830 [Candidatus Omnitrophica bacterium]|nr:hypothetical protein [Candidatus Omnitrophota bacterium]
MVKILTVTLNPSSDKTVLVDKFTPGAEMRVRVVSTVSGGKGVNTARAINALQVPVTALTLQDILPAVEVRENLTVVDTAGNQTRFLEPGPRLPAREWSGIQKFILKRLPEFSFLALCGSLPPGAPVGLYAGLITAAREQGLVTALDTSGLTLAHSISARPWCIKPNRQEAEELLGITIRSVRAVRKALQMLAGCGNTRVLLSLGAEGLAFFDGSDMLMARGPFQEGSTVGCGDASLAGFLAGYASGADSAESLVLAAAAGAANVGSSIPGEITRERVNGLKCKIKVERL